MDYQTRYNKKSFYRGFSLLELIIVISIFSIFAGMTTTTYYSMKSHTNLELATGSLVEAVRFAQSSAQSGKGDSKWGVKTLTDKIVIFKGNDYTSRDTAFDSTFDFSGGVIVSGLSEVVFEKITGSTLTVGTMSLAGTSENRNIVINEKGTINY